MSIDVLSLFVQAACVSVARVACPGFVRDAAVFIFPGPLGKNNDKRKIRRISIIFLLWAAQIEKR